MRPVAMIEDEDELRRAVGDALRRYGFDVLEGSTIADAERLAPIADLLLLDLGLPDGDGLAVLRALRPDSQVPVIVLSARGQEGDKVTALDAGAEDYLTKPFGASELLARIRVALRRVGGTPTPDVIEVGPIKIDQPRHTVTVSGHEVHLTPIEFRLLLELARHPGRVLTHHQLLREIWGPNAVDEVHYLRVHMAHLRGKLEPDRSRPRYLITPAQRGRNSVMPGKTMSRSSPASSASR